MKLRGVGLIWAGINDISKDRLGRHRWVVERTFAWLTRERPLLLRFDRLASEYLSFLHLGCALTCWSYLTKL